MKPLLLLIFFNVFAITINAQVGYNISRYVVSTNNDAEEAAPGGTGTVGSISLTSDDLEMANDGTQPQLIGIRFTNITVPKGAAIVSAYIQFTAKGDKNPAFGAVMIKGENVDSAAEFSVADSNISLRTATSALVTWPGSTSGTWGITSPNVRTAEQKTPDLSAIVKAITSRSGWKSGNAISFIISGSGVRNAWSFDGNATYAPELVIQYTLLTAFPVIKSNRWLYLDDGSNQGTAWRSSAFNDSSWKFGNAVLGYNDPVTTTLNYGADAANKYVTYYFRKQFTVASVAALKDTLLLRLLCDDGAVVYINGAEVLRANMPSGNITNAIPAPNIIEPSDETSYFPHRLLKSILVTGVNTIAVEVHQQSISSPDLDFDAELKEVTAPVLARDPYLQMATTNSIIVRWRTDVPTHSRVAFGTVAGALSTVVDSNRYTTEHIMKLTGLSPDTRYYYSIGNFETTFQTGMQNYFQTLPAEGSQQMLRVGVFGDCGTGSGVQATVRNQFLNYLGNNYLTAWLLLGDNAYISGTDAEFQNNFFNIYKDNLLKKYPLYPAPGNHDYANNTTSGFVTHDISYYRNFSLPTNGEAGGVPSGKKEYYSFNIGNAHFLSLDSYGRESNSLRLYDTLSPQVQWVKQDLAANTNKDWVIAYWHHPPYTMGSHNSDKESELVNIRQNFMRILERYGVDLVLCGHSHVYERSRLMQGHYGYEPSFDSAVHNVSRSTGLYNGSANSCPYVKDSGSGFRGTVYVVSGSAGQVGGMQDSFPHNAMYYSNIINAGAMMLEIEGNRLDAKWICSDGVIRDSFTMMKNVGKKIMSTIYLGDTLALTASFNGVYNWTPGNQTTKSIKVSPPIGSSTFMVSDAYDCIRDTFLVHVKGSNVTDYFRTVSNGNWNDVNIWQSSEDSTTWHTATLTPDYQANSITITDSITITHTLVIDQTVVSDGGFVKVAPSGNVTVKDGVGVDLFLRKDN